MLQLRLFQASDSIAELTPSPHDPARIDAWVAQTIPAYAADKVASGQWPQSTALEPSQQENAALLPLGLATPDNHFFTIVDAAGAPVGMLWFAVKTRFDARIAYVFDVRVRPERRREGRAFAAFAALEDEVRQLGLAGFALQVFGHNTAGQGLYAKLGFRPTSISLFKPVDPPVLEPLPATKQARPDGIGLTTYLPPHRKESST